jgi:hypothetical protein
VRFRGVYKPFTISHAWKDDRFEKRHGHADQLIEQRQERGTGDDHRHSP